MSQGSPKKNKGFTCDVCENKNPPLNASHVTICRECADPKLIRVYHSCCGLRADLTLEQMRKFFETETGVFRTGLVLRFKTCPHCGGDDCYSTKPDIFNIHVPDSELEYFPPLAHT